MNIHSNRVTPDWIYTLQANEIFVFGSNRAGMHGAGAARKALGFGAEYGIGVGLRGQTYALPTKDVFLHTMPLIIIQEYVNDFIVTAIEMPDFTFLVTRVGCGLAGYTPDDIAPLFEDAQSLDNVFLPKEFRAYYQKWS